MNNYRISSEIDSYTDHYREIDPDHEIAERLYAAELAIKKLQTSELIGSSFLMRSIIICCYNIVGIIFVVGAYSVLHSLWEIYWQWVR